MVFIIMSGDCLFEDAYYTDESKVSERVENLNKVVKSSRFWYKTLIKNG